MSDHQYPLKLCLIKYELDIHVFVYLNYSFSFEVSLLNLLAHFLLIRNNGEIIRNYQSQKNDIFFQFFVQFNF